MAVHWQRAVLKIGSNLIAPGGERLSVQHLLGIAQFVQQARAQGREVIIVSSGAVAAGRACLRTQNTDHSIAAKQALAAIGQAQLMRFWQQFVDLPVAQLLLTLDDLLNRRRFVNAKNTLRELLALNVLPIINENDSVAVDELRVGDNDNLAAHVAVLADADLLIIGTDIDGLFTADPRVDIHAKLISHVARVDEAILSLAGGAGSSVGTGGMRTKLQAALKANERGIPCIILNAQKSTALLSVLHDDYTERSSAAQGAAIAGTYFSCIESPLSAKKHWMMHALPSSGRVTVDNGAAQALRERGASLLPSGLTHVDGGFDQGDAIEVCCGSVVLAKGIAQYDAESLRKIAGRRSSEIESRLGYSNGECAIHRDDLVLL